MPVHLVTRKTVALGAAVWALGCGGRMAVSGGPPGALDRIAARVNASGATVGLYYRDLDTGDSLAYAADRRFHAASTMKVPVMVQVFRDRDAGLLSLDDSLVVTRTFASLVDGSPYDLDLADDSDSTLHARVGEQASVRELVELMITVSSNLATNMLITRVGPERANATPHALGADSIPEVLRGVEDGMAYEAGRNNPTTARDLGRVLGAIADGRAASDSSCAGMLAILGRQRFNEENKWVVAGYQAEVEDTPGKAGFLYHESGRGWLVNVGDKVEIGEDGKPQVVGKLGDNGAIGKTYKKSDWNDYVIRCEGNKVQHWLNGIQTIELIDNDTQPAVDKDGKPNLYMARCMDGILALQIHAGPPMWVEYKNVRIKELNK